MFCRLSTVCQPQPWPCMREPCMTAPSNITASRPSYAQGQDYDPASLTEVITSTITGVRDLFRLESKYEVCNPWRAELDPPDTFGAVLSPCACVPVCDGCTHLTAVPSCVRVLVPAQGWIPILGERHQ